MQKQAAKIIGTNATSLMTWERNQRTPSISFIPKIIEFLGYIPFDKEFDDIGNKIAFFRKISGMNFKKLGKLLNIDPGTLSRWEKGETKPSKEKMEKLNDFFSSLKIN